MRAAQEVMTELAGSGLTAAQLALVMELSATVAAEARPVEDKSAQRRRERDRAYQAERRQNRQISADSDDAPFPNERDNLTPTHEDSDEASASSPVRQPVSEAKDFWNEAAKAVGWPIVQSFSASRQRMLGARLRQHGIDGWRAAINRARASPYLAGADPPSWFTFSWIIKAENFLKVTEGNYDRNRSHNPKPSSWGQARDLVRAQPS